MEEKEFNKVRVVTRNFLRDWFQSIRSLFGMRMVSYEERVMQETSEMMKEIKSKGNIDWHRMNIQEVGKDGILINIYGKYV